MDDATDVARDEDTVAYFDEHTPEYGTSRLEPAARFIREHRREGTSLIDVGCGVGNTLEYLVRAGDVKGPAGLDVSARCLEQTRERVDAETFLGSVLDRELVDSIGPRFDFAVVAAVLHHLIGDTRRESREHAELAVANSKRLLKPGGHLIVHEPVYSPYSAMTALFHLKKAVTRVTDRRVGVFGYWNNIGAPVVSYYTEPVLEEMLLAGEPATVVERHEERWEPPRLVRPLVGKASVTLIARKATSS
jgi:SAM-dependent methyltransferase